MKKHIDQLILKHEDQPYKRYIMTCSVDDFKLLQKLMEEEYGFKPDGKKSTWRLVMEDDSNYREGVVKFKGFELNVYCSPKIFAGYTISGMKVLPLIYMDIFK